MSQKPFRKPYLTPVQNGIHGLSMLCPRPQPVLVEEPSVLEAMKQLNLHPQINALFEQLWQKDPYTFDHSHRVADLSQWLAGEAGVSAQERVEIYIAGLLHDLGKIFTPDSVLKKPSRLTVDEFEIMKLHPKDSATIVAQLSDIAYLAPAIHSHHERVDGKGYPDRLMGDKIPVYSRIILIADTFDAMSSDRVYRRQISLEQIYEEIARCSGTQFDSDFAKIFIASHQNRFGASIEEKKAA